MLSKWLIWWFGDLICAKDRSISMTRLAGCTAHFAAAFFFIMFNLKLGEFNFELWATYLGFATGHAYFDKSLMTKGKPNDQSNNN